MRHKFKAIPTTIDDNWFGSKKEAKRFCELRILQESGEVLFFLRQTPFHLPGKIKYLCDFMVFWSDGSITFEDVKGMRTRSYIDKKKQVEEIYPHVKIKEV